MALDDLKPQAAPTAGTDLDSFEGKRIKLAKGEIIDTMLTDPDTGELKPGKALRISTAEVTTLTNKAGDKIPVHASEIFNLKIDKETGEATGWSSHVRGKLQGFLKKMNVTHPKQLFDGEHSVIIRLRKVGEGMNQRTFLGFMYQ